MFYFISLKGLFHPARKIRDVYWKIYNSLYIGAQVSETPQRCYLLSCAVQLL